MIVGRTALLLGASGLVGGHCLHELLRRDEYGRVVVMVRRRLDIRNPKLQQMFADFESPVRVDDVFSCLGTTRAKTPSREEYRRIDYDLPLGVARRAAENGAKRLLVVSAAEADARSRFFYPRVKGELDEAVARLPFEAVHIFRPSLLLGERSEKRPFEAAARKFLPLFTALLAGPLRKYRPIEAETVARAMVRAALGDGRGVQYYDYDRMLGPG